MAHGIESNGDIAYAGETPWHGYGNKIEPDACIEDWRIAGGLMWEVNKVPNYINMAVVTDAGVIDNFQQVPGRYSNVRSDNGKVLGNVGENYKVLQPEDVTKFFGRVVEDYDLQMETLGTLFGGQVVWGLARMPGEFTLPGDDKVQAFLLLSTSYDGRSPTIVMATSVRVVCKNTLHFAYDKDSKRAMRIRHSSKFNADRVILDMGLLGDKWDQFAENSETLATTSISDTHTDRFIMKLMGASKGDTFEDNATRPMRMVKDMLTIGRGAGMKSAEGMVWGVANAVTGYADYTSQANGNKRTGISAEEKRFYNGQFGGNATLKVDAFKLGLAYAEKGSRALTLTA